jgi:hypothetical protein
MRSGIVVSGGKEGEVEGLMVGWEERLPLVGWEERLPLGAVEELGGVDG